MQRDRLRWNHHLAWLRRTVLVLSLFHPGHSQCAYSAETEPPLSADHLLQAAADVQLRLVPTPPHDLTRTMARNVASPDRAPDPFTFGPFPSSYAGRMNLILHDFQETLADPAARNQRHLAEQAFDHLHQTLLTGPYVATCPHVRATMDTGVYNCLTATVLYLALCRSVGIEAQAVAMTGHVYARVTLPEETIDIETTSRRWAPVPAQPGRQVISDRKLIARAYYNLGLALANRQAYALSISATWLSLRLDPDHENSRTNLLATLNNWALRLAEQQHWREAEQVLTAAMMLDADHRETRENAAYLRRCLSSQAPTAAI